MASIKVKFRPSTVLGHEGTIYYQIIHQRIPRQLLSDYHIFPNEWDEKHSCIILSNAQKFENKDKGTGKADESVGGRASFLRLVHDGIRMDMERLKRIIQKLEYDGMAYSADDVVEEFRRFKNEYSLFNFMERIIAKLKDNNKVRTAETYRSTLNSFKKFRNNEDIIIDSINSSVVEAYQAWLQNIGVTINTIAFYMRILRATYNRAVEEEDSIEDRKPFRHVHTNPEKTTKRALSLNAIKQIKELDLSNDKNLDYARDIFLMSFMLRGMSFIDMAFLQKTDLKNGRVCYRRHKTHQRLSIKWTSEMQAILDKYPENSSDYLFPIIRNIGTNERRVYLNMGYHINCNLKKIADMVGLSIPLTLYVARHSWASIARSNGVSISVISEGMGHDSEKTTQIYLASIDTCDVDKANSRHI